MSIFSGVSGCVSLSVQIVDLLLTSKSNKHEFTSLQSAVQNIKLFLTVLPEEGITQQGNQVLRQLHAQLLQVHSLLSKVAGMGPLVSLLKAHHVREEFLRTNRDLLDTFGILARGEQLLRGVAVGGALQDQEQRLADISRDLRSCRSEFFSEEQAAQGRLLDVAAAGRKRAWPEELLQHKLLSELKVLPQVSELDSNALLEEFRALQMLALYNGPTAGAGAGAGAGADNDSNNVRSSLGPDGPAAADLQGKKSKHMDEDLEEFLLQQVCAALAPSVAAASSQPLQAGPEPPTEYLCPIGQQVMVEPVLLIETGHSYEAANISRWLDMHDTCPLTGQTLHSKQLSSNRALKHLIADWAAAHGIALPAAPAYTPLAAVERLPSAPAAAALPVAAAAAAPSFTVLHMSQLQGSNSSSSRDVLERGQDQDQQPSEGPGKDPADLGSSRAAAHRGSSKQGCCQLRCTRTRWAAAALALVVVLGAAVGIGVWAAKSNVKAPPKPVAGVSPALAANRSDVVGPSSSPLPDPASFTSLLGPSPSPSRLPNPAANSSASPSPTPLPSPATNTSPSSSPSPLPNPATIASASPSPSPSPSPLPRTSPRPVPPDAQLSGGVNPKSDLNMCLSPFTRGAWQGFALSPCPVLDWGNLTLEQTWDYTDNSLLRSASADKCLAVANGTCADLLPGCAALAAQGDCQANPDFMVGVMAQRGQCMDSCKACKPGTSACVDASPKCAEWAASGECQLNPGYMVGNGVTQGGYCRASCKVCLQDGCVDILRNCTEWAAKGECKANIPYMLGNGSHPGRCRSSCKACAPTPSPPSLILVDCKQATAAAQWTFNQALRSVSHPEACLAPPAPDAFDKQVGLASCPKMNTVEEAAMAWRMG